MGDTIVIETPVATVLEVSGLQGPQGPAGAAGATGATGPQGPAGTGIETLTTKGDLLSRNDSTAIRVGIGSTGQVLKVSAQGLPSWANESGAVTSVNGQTGAVTVAAATHAAEHEAGEADEIQAMAALVATEDASLNGIYVPNASGTTSGGRLTLYKPGTRENTKLEYSVSLAIWLLIKNAVVQLEGQEANATHPWTPQQYIDPRSPQVLPNGGTVTRAPLEILARRAADGTSNVALATTSADGLLSSSDKTKLNGIASGAEVNVNADWNASSGDAQILNKPSTFAPSAHSSSHASAGSDPLAPSDIGAQFAFVTTLINLSSGDTYTIASGRARRIEVGYASSDNGFVRSPSSGSQIGDLIVVAWTTGSSGPAGNVIIQGYDGGQYVTLATLDILTESVRLIFKANGAWEIDSVYTHTHAASAITSGTLAHERGGLEADVSAYSGLVKISGGSTSAVTVTSAGEALLDDADAAAQRTTLGLGTAAVEAASAFAQASHSHELTALAATGATNGHVLTANGSNGVTFAALPTSGVTSVSGTAPIVSSGGTTPAISVTIGTTAGTVAAGDDSRITGAAQKSANLSDLASASTARTNLGLGTAATAATGDFAAASHTHTASAISDSTTAGRALLTAADAAAQRTSLGLSAIATSGSASDLGSGTVPIARLGASGTPSGSTYLAGDNSWKAVSGVTTGSVDNAVLRADGTGGSTSQSSDINIEDATTSTANNVTISNQHSGQTNSSLVLAPKGTGALLASKPTGTSAGGNARGANATDWQTVRNTAAQVASGTCSVIIGGELNTASNTDAICGGYLSTASGEMSIAFGRNCLASGQRSAAIGGNNHTTSALYSSVFGGVTNVASALYASVFAGNDSTASAEGASCIGASNALANRYYMQAHSAGVFAAQGDAQRARFVLRCKTTTNAAVEMGLNGSTTYLTIPSGKVIYAEIRIVGTKSDGSAVACYTRQYAAKNVGGTSSEVFAPVTIGTDNAAGTSLEVATVDAGDYIRVRPTGILSEVWRWVASVDAVEVAYGT